MEEQQVIQPSIKSILGQLTIRTMAHDLEMLAQKEKKEVPLPAVKVAETKQVEKVKKPKPISVAEQLLDQAKQAYTQKNYQETLSLSQEILQDKTSSWSIRFQANRLINKIENAKEKLAKQRQEKLQEQLAKEATPALTAPAKTKTFQPLAKLGTLAKIFKPKPAARPLMVEPAAAAAMPPEMAAFLESLKKELPAQSSPPTKPKLAFLSNIVSAFSSIKAGSFSMTKIGSLFKPLLTSGLILGGSIVVLIIVLTYASSPSPPPPPEPTPKPEPPIPAALFLMEHQEIIELNEAGLPQLLEKIKTLSEISHPTNQFVHLVVKQVNGEIKYPDLNQILTALAIVVPPLDCPPDNPCSEDSQLMDNLAADQFSLFLYYPKESPEPFILTSATSSPLGQSNSEIEESSATSTAAVRLGLIARTKNSARVKQILFAAESTLSQIFEPLLLGEKPVSDTRLFKDNSYQGFAIRYINFPEKFLSLDYAIGQDWLLIATSKENTYAAIDRISPPQ